MAAKADDGDGACVTYIGSGGSGHFVKMVHNGIEYGDMQLIAEAYDLLKRVGGLDNDQMKDVFLEWNNGPLKSFLIEITTKVIDFKPTPTAPASDLIDMILDKAGQKGTGKWTTQTALDLGIPDPDHHRRRGRPQPVGPEGPAGQGRQGAQGADAGQADRRPEEVHRRRRRRPVLQRRSAPTPRAWR